MVTTKIIYAGTHRARSFEDTLAWLWPKAREVGVTRLANVTGLDVVGIPVWTAVRPNSRGLATSQGKGFTHEAAQVSALMECVESWHAENIVLPVRIADFESMHGLAAVDPVHLNHYSDAIPRPDVAFPWVEGCDVVAQRPCWVPFESVSTNYVADAHFAYRPTFLQSSNGLAGGNTKPEAVVHALAEVIERHAIARCHSRVRAFDPDLRVALSTIDDENCLSLLQLFHEAGLLVAVFQLPSELDIPAFAATIVDAEEKATWRSLPPFNGYGCHLDPAVALSRALTEAAQSRATFISGSRDDISGSEYARSGNPDDLRAYRSLLNGSTGNRTFLRRAMNSFSLEADVDEIIEVLRRGGYGKAVVVDLSRPEIGVPVVKAIVPGLTTPEGLLHSRGVSVSQAGDS